MTEEINELVKILPILKNARMELELMNYHEYIMNAREKRYTYKTIAKKLKENGITVSTTTLQRLIRSKNAEKNNIHP
jgi:arginine repressor